MASGLSGYAVDPRMMQNAATVPKEIGFLTRAEGLRSGLDELHSRLEAFAARVAGTPNDPNRPTAPGPQGLHGELSTAEDRLRSCLQLLGKLNDAF